MPQHNPDEVEVRCTPQLGGYLFTVTNTDGTELWTHTVTHQQFDQYLDGGPNPTNLLHTIEQRLGGTWTAPTTASRGAIRVVRTPASSAQSANVPPPTDKNPTNTGDTP
jgi:hypothetical protein